MCVCVYVCVLSFFSHVQLFATLWTLACKAPLSMGFSRQEYWSRLPFPLPGDFPDPGIELVSLASPALAGKFFTTIADKLIFKKSHGKMNPCKNSQKDIKKKRQGGRSSSVIKQSIKSSH